MRKKRSLNKTQSDSFEILQEWSLATKEIAAVVINYLVS